MAIDTAAKRKSCIGLALLFLRAGIVPSGSNLDTAEERLHTNGFYALTAVAADPVPETTYSATLYVHDSEERDMYVTTSRARNMNINSAEAFTVHVAGSRAKTLHVDAGRTINLEVA